MFETMLKVSDDSKPKKPLAFCSNYLKNRGSLIDWMFEISKKLELSLNTTHLAVAYLDIIKAQDQEDIFPIHLYSTTSLLLAGIFLKFLTKKTKNKNFFLNSKSNRA